MVDIENKESDNISTEVFQIEDIKNLILSVRGKQVLLDSDVAYLYGYETKYINRAATRNKERFPQDFRFQLTKEEVDKLQIRNQEEYQSISPRFQNGTLDTGRGSNIKYMPFVYTEQGIGMLSGLLKNITAIRVSIGIMNAFVEMRQFINANRDVFANITNINNRLIGIDGRLQEQDRKLYEVFDMLQKPEVVKQNIFYKGQFFDAFALIIGFIKKANAEITIIDNYADNSVLDMLSNKNHGVTVKIITANPGKIGKLYLEKFERQYGEVSVIKSNEFHDRFIIVDNIDVYVLGASLKDAGNKCFAISKSEDTEMFLEFVGTI